MDPLNTTQSGGIFEWKKKAMQRSYQAGQRYNKHLRKMNKHVPRLKIRGDSTKPSNADANKDIAYQENVRLNSLISNLAQRSTEFGITMEEEDDISDGLLSDGLVEAIPDNNASDLASLGMCREAAVMSPEVVGCVTINGFAFRTFPNDSNDDIAATWGVKPELDQDVKPNMDELNKVLFPTKTTDITKIKGWRNKVFAENDEFTMKQESEENWDAKKKQDDQSRSVDSKPSTTSLNQAEKSTLLNCALTLPYASKARSTVPQGNQKPKTPGQNLSVLKAGVANMIPLAARPAFQKSPVLPIPCVKPIKPIVETPAIQPIAMNPTKKPKTKAEYRRMLEEAAHSREAQVPVAPPAPEVQRKLGPLPKWQGNIMKPTAKNVTIFEKPSMILQQDTGRVDRRLKAYRKEQAERDQMAEKLPLDSRYMYALVDGRPIKIGGSVLAKKMAEKKKVESEKPVKVSPPKPVDPRYTSLLAPFNHLAEPPGPRVKQRNRGKPLSKKLEARDKHPREFCLRLHPAVGYPLTDAAFEQVALLRDDQWDISDDWMKFATSLVKKKKRDFQRKGFVEKVIKTADVLLPVRVTRSGKRYEAGNMENFNMINILAAEADDVTDHYTYQNCAADVKDADGSDSEIRSLLRSMVDSVAKQATVEDLHLLAEPKQLSLDSHDFLNPTRTAAAHPRKRRSALNIELRRLNVLVIEERETEAEEVPKEPSETVDAPACRKEFCKFGCLCLSLERSAGESSHCGRVDCMFECVCGGSSTGAEERGALPKSVVSKIAESTKYLARTEKEFQRAVVCNKNEMLVVDGCAAPATGRRKREVKLPVRFRESGIDDKMLFGGNANREVVEARKQGKMAEDPAIENVEVKSVMPADPNEDPTFGLAGCPFFVPNHVKSPEFFLHRLEGRALEKTYALQYQLKPSNVVMYRAKLDNVQPFCIVHDKYACSCLQFLNPGGSTAADSPRQSSSVRKPFHSPSSKRRNVAVKKTAPRLFPAFSFRNRCSRTEGVPENIIIRNRDSSYKALLETKQKMFRARLYGRDRTVTIPGSQILPNVKHCSDSLVKGSTAEESRETKRFVAPKENSQTEKLSDPELLYKSVCKSLLNPMQIIPSNFKPKQSKGTPVNEIPGVMKGSTTVRVPPGSQTKMMRWNLLQESFLNNSLQMWLSSPEIGSPRLYVSSNRTAPIVKCRNLRNWTGKTERGYPPLVAELMEQIPDETAGDLVRYGVMLKHKNHWEVIGIRKLPYVLPGDLTNGSSNVKFLKDNAIMSVPLPAVRYACRWHIIYIDCPFDRIVFQGCVIIEKNIIQLRDGSQMKNCVNAILFRENFLAQFKSLDLPRVFGLYALPKIRECVFLGPFGLESSKGDVVSMFKDVTGKGKESTTGRIFVEVVQPKSRSTWLFAEGLSEKDATNYVETWGERMKTDRHAKSPAVKKTVASQGDGMATSSKEPVIRKKLPAAVEHYNKNPLAIAASIKNRMLSSSVQRSRIGCIGAKRVAGPKVFARRPYFATTKPAALKIGAQTPKTPPPITKTSPLSVLKGAPLIPKESSEFPLPVECVVEEIATSSEEIIELLPTRPEKTKKSSPIRFDEQMLLPSPAGNQVELLPFGEEAICSPTRVEKPVEDLEAALRRLQLPPICDKVTPPPLSALHQRRRSSVTFSRSRTPSMDYGSPPPCRPMSGASSCSSISTAASCLARRASEASNSGDISTVTAPVANRPGLTITGQSSAMTAAALGRSISRSTDNYQVVEVVLSDDDAVEHVPAKVPAAAEDADLDIMVVPRTWQPGTVPPDLPLGYEPAEINTRNVVGEMFAAAVVGSTHVKYVPSIPSLGYVEAYRLPDNTYLIRFLDKPHVEAKFAHDAILPHLDKSIRTNPLLLVDPPDLPLTWQATEDMDSFPDILPFNYAQTFDGNHMLCEKGLLRKQVCKEQVPKADAQDEDVVALQQLKKIVGVPDIQGVSLEEILSQVAGEILQCQRLEHDLEYKLKWWTRRRRKTRKRLVRMILAQPSKEERRLLIEKMGASCKSSRTFNDDPEIQIVDVPDEGADNVPGNGQLLGRQEIDISGPVFSLSGMTPRRLETILFPADLCAPQSAGIRITPKLYSEKCALLNAPSTLPTRSPDSLLRKSQLHSASSSRAVIPLMDLTDDNAPPTVVLQTRPELPVVNLEDEDDNQGPSQPAASDKIDTPKPWTADKGPIVYSYGVNSAGHFFRCAIINNRIVNKVRITKVPDNVECLRMVEQPNPAMMQRRMGGNGAAAIAGVVSGTQKLGVRLANTRAQGSLVVVGSTKSNVLQSFGQKLGMVPVGRKLSHASRPHFSGYQIVGHKAGATSIRIPNDWAQQCGQATQKEVIMVGQPSNAPKTIGQLAGNVPNEVRLGKTVGTAPLCSGVEGVTILNSNVEIEGNVDETKGVCEVVNKLISTGNLTGNTRQIMIKGPMLPRTPNILKRQFQLTHSTVRDVHAQAGQASAASQAVKSIENGKQFVKMCPSELQRRPNSMINIGNVGKFVKLKLQTAPTQVKSNTETAAKSPGNQLGPAIDAIAVEVASKPAILVEAPMHMPIAVAEVASEPLILVDASMQMPITVAEVPSETEILVDALTVIPIAVAEVASESANLVDAVKQVPNAVAVEVATEPATPDAIPMPLPAAVGTVYDTENLIIDGDAVGEDLVIDQGLHSEIKCVDSSTSIVEAHSGNPGIVVLQIEERLESVDVVEDMTVEDDLCENAEIPATHSASASGMESYENCESMAEDAAT